MTIFDSCQSDSWRSSEYLTYSMTKITFNTLLSKSHQNLRSVNISTVKMFNPLLVQPLTSANGLKETISISNKLQSIYLFSLTHFLSVIAITNTICHLPIYLILYIYASHVHCTSISDCAKCVSTNNTSNSNASHRNFIAKSNIGIKWTHSQQTFFLLIFCRRS